MDERPSRNEPLVAERRLRRPARVRARSFAVAPLLRLDARPRRSSRCSSRCCRSRRSSIDRGSTTTVAVVVDRRRSLPQTTRDILTSILNVSGERVRPRRDRVRRGRRRSTQVDDRELDAAVVADRAPPTASLVFSFHLGETMGQQQIQDAVPRRVRRRRPRLRQRTTRPSRLPAAADRRLPRGRRRRRRRAVRRIGVREPADRRRGVRVPDLHHDRDLRDVGRRRASSPRSRAGSWSC